MSWFELAINMITDVGLSWFELAIDMTTGSSMIDTEETDAAVADADCSAWGRWYQSWMIK